MPPLPVLRYSPGREHMTENGHKRGQSFESGSTLKTMDDDLVLFNEVQNQERENFLLHTADDLDDSLSKLRHISDFKLGINIPKRGECSDLLNVEGEKNDYDWLLTPPETPLFPTLDVDDPQPVTLEPRGRPRSQPIQISRSVTHKSYQASQTSYSSQRLSPSPRPGGSLAQMRGRSSSAPQSSPPPVIRSTTPTPSPCTPPYKPSTSAPRSSTPPLRRKSTSSSIQVSKYGGREDSPVKASLGNSASPNLQGWQMILPGFNSEVPLNLRTSLSDGPVSHVRGSSPASRNVRELSMKLGRKSMSPTSSRSISSSHSQERDHFSSYSKGFMASSGDDDEESLHCITKGISRSSPPRKHGALANNKAMSFSRKQSRTSTSNSVPNRSFDSSLRLMDQCITPQNMFRPLLSSVPATTFRPIFSRNSSLTTSSNTSSEQGVISFAPDVDGGELEQNDLPGGWKRTEDFDFDAHEGVFLFDKVVDIIGDTSDEAPSGKHERCDEDFAENLRKKFDSEYIQNPIVSITDRTISITTFESAHCAENQCDIDTYPIMAVCSKCGKELYMDDTVGNINLCEVCAEEDGFFTAERALTCAPFTENEVLSQMDTAVDALSKEGQFNSGVREFYKDDNQKVKHVQHERNIELAADFFPNIFPLQLLDQNESKLYDQHLDIKKYINVTQGCRGSTCQPSNHAGNPTLKVDVPEGTGISVLLLQGSTNSKWPILQGKTLSATNILCSEPSYSRNNASTSRTSFGLDGSSATSSTDLGLFSLSETYFQQQMSRKNEVFVVDRDIDRNVRGTSSDNDASPNFYEPKHVREEFKGKNDRSTVSLRYDSSSEMILITEGHSDSLNQSNLNSTPSSMPVISEDCRSVHADNCRTVRTSASQHINCEGNNDLPCSSVVEIMHAEDCTSSVHTDEGPQNSESNVQNLERKNDISVCSEMEEDHITVSHTFESVILDAATNCASVVTIKSQDGDSELEYQQTDRLTESMPSHIPPSTEHSNEQSISQISENDISICSSEPIPAVLQNGESGITMVEGRRGHRLSRNLTLEDATDTILFCSSIIHDLAYKVASISMEKEQEEVPLPTVTGLGKAIPGLREDSRDMSNKKAPIAHKFKRTKMEAKTRSPLREEVVENKNDVIVEEFTAPMVEIMSKVDSSKPQKLESKCNCSVL